MSSYFYSADDGYWGRVRDWLDSRLHLSPEGRMLARLDEAAARVTTESDITDELRCHLRRIDKGARA